MESATLARAAGRHWGMSGWGLQPRPQAVRPRRPGQQAVAGEGGTLTVLVHDEGLHPVHTPQAEDRVRQRVAELRSRQHAADDAAVDLVGGGS